MPEQDTELLAGPSFRPLSSREVLFRAPPIYRIPVSGLPGFREDLLCGAFRLFFQDAGVSIAERYGIGSRRCACTIQLLVGIEPQVARSPGVFSVTCELRFPV
jgi:hypothetical protein